MTRNTRDLPKTAVEILAPADFMRLRAAEHATEIRRSHGHLLRCAPKGAVREYRLQ